MTPEGGREECLRDRIVTYAVPQRRVESRLPDEIDTDRDGDTLAEVGLDRTELMNKLAGGSFGTTLSP
jgi:hypothetical protein